VCHPDLDQVGAHLVPALLGGVFGVAQRCEFRWRHAADLAELPPIDYDAL